MKQRLRVSHVAHHYAHRNCPHVSGETRPGCIPKSQMTHILEDLIHKMEGQPSTKTGQMSSRHKIDPYD